MLTAQVIVVIAFIAGMWLGAFVAHRLMQRRIDRRDETIAMHKQANYDLLHAMRAQRQSRPLRPAHHITIHIRQRVPMQLVAGGQSLIYTLCLN